LGILKDQPRRIEKKILSSLKTADLVLVSGGSSVGREDFMPEVISRIGKVLLHGVSIKPGKPLLVGKVQGKLVLGIPGYPTSALTVFHAFIVALINHMMNKEHSKLKLEARLSEPFSSGKRHTFLSVKLAERGGVLYAKPVFKGSSAITSLSMADGFVEVPPGSKLKKNARVVATVF